MARKHSNPANSNKPFPAALRALMEERNTSQKDLADYLGKTRQAISLYCNGESAPDLETLAKIAQFFNTSSDYLLGLEADPAKKPSAATELGLSPNALIKIKQISCDLDRLSSLNMILESSSMLRLLDSLKTIPKAIAAESDYINRMATSGKSGACIECKDDPDSKMYVSELGTLGQYIASEITSNDLAGELITSHPELKDRIIVIHGYDAIERHIDELGNRFAFLLKNETGFYDLTDIRFKLSVEQSNQRIGVDNGND